MLNKTFGNLIVISERIKVHNGKRYRNYRDCICVCGTKTRVREDNLKSGNTEKCGCMLKIPSTVQRNLEDRIDELESKIKKYEKALKEIVSMPYNLRENMVTKAKKALEG